MYAVVSTGGKQLKVEKGAEAVVERLAADVGATVTLDVLCVADGERFVVRPEDVASATVTAEVVEHFRGEKAVVFKFKKRKGYKRLKGHRQEQTRIRITDIVMDGDVPVVQDTVAKRPRKQSVATVDVGAKGPEGAGTPSPKDSVDVRCVAVKGTGEPCGNKAKSGSEYCGVHAKKHEDQ